MRSARSAVQRVTRGARAGARPRAHVAFCLASIAALALACGEPAPEERLADAKESVNAAARETKLAQAQVERLRSQVGTRKAELAEAERELAEAQEELAATARHAERRIGDVALFRALQGRMLEDDALENVAVRVTVEDRRVTLSGEVDTKDQAERALEIARSGFGVAGVNNRLQVIAPPEQAD